MQSNLPDLKSRYSIAQAWRDLGLAGEPAKICRSPFPGEHKNGDAHPSFSVFAEGGRFKDHATGAGGDVFDFVAKARGTDVAGSIAWVRDRLGVERPVTARTGGTPWPELRPGTADECVRLAKLRYITPEAVRLATERGFLFFGTLWGRPFWAVADQRRKLVEFRQLDGQPWPAFGRLAERKSHCLGSGKDWPVGTLEAAPSATVVWLEGAGDFLAFWHFALIEGRTKSIAPVAMLGAANHRVAGDALARFHGKRVVLYPHVDDAGRTAAKTWARQLRAVGAAVSAFDLSGFTKDDGTPGKDLNDVCHMSADCFEQADCYRFREVLP
ncbi:MAG: hypothetical protein EXS37_15105 [Opitutus sp.]|nr:hypothetical protein [Opitutus sp.]